MRFAEPGHGGVDHGDVQVEAEHVHAVLERVLEDAVADAPVGGARADTDGAGEPLQIERPLLARHGGGSC